MANFDPYAAQKANALKGTRVDQDDESKIKCPYCGHVNWQTLICSSCDKWFKHWNDN